jgi:hypothetical protein
VSNGYAKSPSDLISVISRLLRADWSAAHITGWKFIRGFSRKLETSLGQSWRHVGIGQTIVTDLLNIAVSAVLLF